MLRTWRLDQTVDLQSMQAEWEAVRKSTGGSIFTSFDWAIEWLRHFDKVASPRVVFVEEYGQVIAIAPFVLTEQKSMGLRLKKLSLIGNGAGVAELYELGLLVDENREDVLERIVEEMDKIEWNVLHLNEMSDGAVAQSLYRKVAERWETDELVHTPCPVIDIPPEGDVMEVLSSRTKRSLRKISNGLEAESRIRYRCVDLPKEAEEAVSMYTLQHLARWEDKGGSIFSSENLSSFLKQVMTATVAEGRGMIYEVWIDGSLASQMLCLEDGDIMRAYRVGMSNKFSEFSPGNLVSLYALTEAQKAGFTKFDFGAGPEEYKYRFGARDVPLLRIQAKRGTVRAMSKITSLPVVKQLVDRSGVKDQALKAMHE
ncbi:MAG: GNAT family N-acetyltransferase [Methanomassiliicoccus sp.]|nr:GNAT family N-acetyltransferase [Methanomassiliicoccus sp.]